MAIPAATVAVALVATVFLPKTYTSVTTITARATRSAQITSPFAGLAGQLGIPLTPSGETPEYFADLLQSQSILREVLLSPLPRPNSDSSTTILQAFAPKLSPISRDLARAINKLRRQISTKVDSRTQILTVRVDARSPELAAAITRTLVERLNHFNFELRRSQGAEQRRFLDTSVHEAEARLQGAEAELYYFYARNRQSRDSPTLVYQQRALQRQVDIQQDLYMALRRQLESARLEEVNNTPVVRIIDPAERRDVVDVTEARTLCAGCDRRRDELVRPDPGC